MTANWRYDYPADCDQSRAIKDDLERAHAALCAIRRLLGLPPPMDVETTAVELARDWIRSFEACGGIEGFEANLRAAGLSGDTTRH